MNRSNSPGCGVNTRGPPGSLEHANRFGQREQAVGVDDHWRLDLAVQRARRVRVSAESRPRPGPIATTVALCAKSSTSSAAGAAMWPFSSGRPCVMYDGSNDATTSCTQRGTASVTRPAPLRSVARPASAIAPLMPREPPMRSARP